MIKGTPPDKQVKIFNASRNDLARSLEKAKAEGMNHLRWSRYECERMTLVEYWKEVPAIEAPTPQSLDGIEEEKWD